MYKIDKINEIRKQKKVTYDKLAELTGISISTIKDIFRGKTTSPRMDTMESIISALNFTADEDDEMIKLIGGFKIPQDRYAIPLVGNVVCGKPVETPENLEGYVYIDYKNADEYFALRVHGDSMTGAGITPKSVLIVHKQNYADDGDIVVASIDGESTTKRFKRNGDVIFLMPENTAYNPIVVTDKNNFYIFGKVVEVRTTL